jgi:Protein of unknown function (DUF1674)
MAIFRPPLLFIRFMASKPPLNRPAPLPLPIEQQREFEALQRRRAEEQASTKAPHPDAPIPLKAEFDGDINPSTGERGGPKREPVQRWVEEEGDWSFKGRVSDF